MKLTKENIYVPLEGYSEEELTELYNFLESINEPCEEFLNLLIKRNKTLEFWDGMWFTDHSAGNKTPVTIKQLKEILQPVGIQFTPIAMKCTQEQFDAIKPKLTGLKVKNISSFSDCDYLVNNLAGERKLISNVMDHAKTDHNREVYEIWNEEIFLKACGIEVETFQDLNDKNMVDLMGYSVLVDTEEQARKLQEIAFEQGFTWSYSNEKIKHLGEKSFQFGFGGDKIITYYSSNNHYEGNFITKKAHFNDLFDSLEQRNMKLTKEQVYVNLQGKTEEELTDLLSFLKENNEPLEDFIEKEIKKQNTIEWYNNEWLCDRSAGNKTEVTIEQLKDILQPVGIQFTPIAMKCTQEQFDAIKPKLNNKKSLNIFMFNKEWNSFYLALFEDGSITNGLTHSGNGEIHEEWNEEVFLKACGIETDTLEQQLEKAKAEVERLEKEIENNKIKVGDWVWNSFVKSFYKKSNSLPIQEEKKITNTQLIELLENEMK